MEGGGRTGLEVGGGRSRRVVGVGGMWLVAVIELQEAKRTP